MDFVASTYYSDIFMGGFLVLLLIVYFVVVALLVLSFSLDFLYINFFFFKFLNFLSKIQTCLDYTFSTAYMLSLVLSLSHQHHFDKNLIASTHISFVTLFQFFFFNLVGFIITSTSF